jgi:hypothetical protein
VERKWGTLIAVSVAIFMLLLDITVVNLVRSRDFVAYAQPRPAREAEPVGLAAS